MDSWIGIKDFAENHYELANSLLYLTVMILSFMTLNRLMDLDSKKDKQDD